MANTGTGTITGTLNGNSLTGMINFGNAPNQVQRKQFKFFEKFEKSFKKLINAGSGLTSIMGAFGEMVGALVDVLLMPIFPALIKWLRKFGEFIQLVRSKGLMGALSDMGFWRSVWDLAKSQLKVAFALGAELIKDVFKMVLIGLWDWFKGLIAGLWGWMKGLLASFWEWLGSFMAGLWNAFVNFLTNLPKILGMVIGFIIGAAAAVIWETIKGLGKVALWLGEQMVRFVTWLGTLPGKLWDGLKALGPMLWDALRALPGLIMSGLAALPGLIVQGLSSLGQIIADAFKKIMGGVTDFGGGLKSGFESGWNTVTGWVN